MDLPLTRRQALGALGALAFPLDLSGREWGDLLPRSAPGAASESGADTERLAGPDLGNLHAVVEWIRQEHAPALSFLESRWSSLDAWKGEARAALLRHHSFRAEPSAVRGEVVGREDRRGYRVESVMIHAGSAPPIPARVLIPSRRRGRLPAVVALHCHGGQYRWGYGKVVSSPNDPPALVEYRDSLYGRPYAEHLAQRGFLVVAIDAFYFGARRLRPDTLDAAAVPVEAREHLGRLPELPRDTREHLAASNRVAAAFETVVAKTLSAAGATWPGLIAWDDRRTVDYLVSRPDVDPERIGCVGLSAGGLRAAHLTGSDPRIKVACIVAWMTELGELLANHARRHTWMAYTPGLYTSLDLPDVAALVAPGALLVQQCERDTLFPQVGMRGAVEKLERIYAKAGIAERFRGTFYDEPHSFRPRMQDDAFDWFERWL